MYEYHSRPMNSLETCLQKHICYSESRIKTGARVAQEQFLLWLFPTLLLLVIWRIYGSAFLPERTGYLSLTVFYLTCAIIGSLARLFKERRTAVLMENQSLPIKEEFRIGQVETCEFRVSKAFLLHECEDEGPTYILDVGDNLYTIINEHGTIIACSRTPGDSVEIVRLPTSKRILATNWSGDPLPIAQTISAQVLKLKVYIWKEGDIIAIENDSFR